MRWIRLFLIPIFGTSIAGIAQGSPQFTVGNLPSFFQGSFGTSSTLNIFYDATYFQYQDHDLRLKLTVPYLSVNGLPNGAALSGGNVVRRNKSTTKTHDANGLGDIWLAAHYTAIQGGRPYAGHCTVCEN